MQPQLFTLVFHLGSAALGSLQFPKTFPVLGRSQMVQAIRATGTQDLLSFCSVYPKTIKLNLWILTFKTLYGLCLMSLKALGTLDKNTKEKRLPTVQVIFINNIFLESALEKQKKVLQLLGTNPSNVQGTFELASALLTPCCDMFVKCTYTELKKKIHSAQFLREWEPHHTRELLQDTTTNVSS